MKKLLLWVRNLKRFYTGVSVSAGGWVSYHALFGRWELNQWGYASVWIPNSLLENIIAYLKYLWCKRSKYKNTLINNMLDATEVIDNIKCTFAVKDEASSLNLRNYN